MFKPISILIHILARMHQWAAIVAVIVSFRPMASLNEGDRRRLQYAFLMLGRRTSARRWYARLLRRDRRGSADTMFWLARIAQHLGRIRLTAILYRRMALCGTTLTEVKVAQTMADASDSLASGGIDRELAELVTKLSLNEAEPIVLVPVGSNVAELFGFWLEQARKHTKERIVGIALDKGAVELLDQALDGKVVDVSHHLVFGEDGKLQILSKKTLWVLRSLLLRELITRGHVVTSMDVDALVFDDLKLLLNSFPSVDVVAQQDYSLPVDVARKLGFVLCCGFMVFRPTPATKEFVKRFAQRTIREMDDQLALNHLIGEAGLHTKVNDPRYIAFEADGVRWLCPNKLLVSRDIAYGSVIRHFQQRDQTVAEIRSLCKI